MNFKDFLKNLNIFNKATPTKEIHIDPISSRIKRGKVDVNTWRTALYRTDTNINPKFEDIQNQYLEIDTDASVHTAKTTRKNFIQGRAFKLSDNQGVENEKAMELFNQKWFGQFISHTLDSIFFGYSFVKLGDVFLDENKIACTDLMLRQNCNPKLDMIFERPTQSGEGTSIYDPQIKDWVIKIEGFEGFNGLYNKVAPYFIYNRLAYNEFAIFTSRYGTGNYIYKTDSQDEEYLRTVTEYLSNLSSSSFAVMGKDDELALVQPAAANAQIFTELSRICNEAITKLILGSDLSGEKSFVGSAEIRYSISNLYSENDIRFVQTIVNEELLPRLINLGFTYLTGLRFEYSQESIAIDPTTQQASVIQLLGLGYEIPDDELSSIFGVTLTKSKNISGDNNVSDNPQS